MKYYISILLLIVTLPALLTCASDDEKVPSVEADIARRAFDLSIKIKEAYLEKDSNALITLCGKDLYDKLVSEMGRFKGNKMEFRMRWVDIDEEDIVHLYVQWNKVIDDPGGGDQITGLALFVINKDFIAIEIMRENPFMN